MNYEKCYNCGAEHGLHQSGTNHCPVGGVEETRDGHKQKWADTYFLEHKQRQIEIDMQELLLQMLEAAKKDKKTFKALKNSAVKCQQFELAANLREMEKELFPESEEVKQAKEKAKELNLVLRMVDLNVSEDVCWLISETLKVHSKLKGKFSVKQAAELVVKRKDYFETE